MKKDTVPKCYGVPHVVKHGLRVLANKADLKQAEVMRRTIDRVINTPELYARAVKLAASPERTLLDGYSSIVLNAPGKVHATIRQSARELDVPPSRVVAAMLYLVTSKVTS